MPTRRRGGNCKAQHHEGGKRKKRGTRKLSKGASDWNKLVMRVHKERKSKDSSAKFGDSLKEASKRKKAGEF